MFRTSTLLLLGALLALGCGDDDDTVVTDAGTDATTPEVDGGGEDAGPRPRDSGVDAGPSCTEGCEIVQVVVGHRHTCARRENGQVLCWGNNSEGELGDGIQVHEACRPTGVTPGDCTARPVVVVGVDANVISARAGFQTCAITDEDTRCWGLSDVPPPGSEGRQQRFVAVPIAGLSPAAEVQAAGSTTCVRLLSGTVACTGANGFGQLLGEDDMDRREAVILPGLESVLEIDNGAHGAFACARTADSLSCWGANDALQLGRLATEEDPDSECGIAPSVIPCRRTPVTVDGLDAAEVTQVELGSLYGCALLADGTVWCWGSNGMGQLGDPEFSEPRSLPRQVPGLANITQIAVGYAHACALRNDGELWCWGRNDEGQVGDGLDIDSAEARCDSNTVVCTLAPTRVVGDLRFVQVAAGYKSTCGVTDDGDVFCWGWNEYRQIGQTDRIRRTMPTRVAGLN
ncbi:MAG: hypothetical protein KF901_04485 [Myxococcales bacterium]|nr:hypothetical protein [Myxococcales bacterium]